MILTILAPEVAARTGQGQTSGAWMEMVERLLLNGIDGQRTRLGIDLADKHTVLIAPAAADACLTIHDTAMMRTELTHYCPTLQCLIITTLHQNTIAS